MWLRGKTCRHTVKPKGLEILRLPTTSCEAGFDHSFVSNVQVNVLYDACLFVYPVDFNFQDVKM